MVAMIAEIGAGIGIAGVMLAVLRARRRADLDLDRARRRDNARARRYVRHRSCGWRNVSRA